MQGVCQGFILKGPRDYRDRKGQGTRREKLVGSAGCSESCVLS